MLGLSFVIAVVALILAILAYRQAGGGVKDLKEKVDSIREKAAERLTPPTKEAVAKEENMAEET